MKPPKRLLDPKEPTAPRVKKLLADAAPRELDPAMFDRVAQRLAESLANEDAAPDETVPAEAAHKK